ncbi:helix-turn-helix domain-containing protein [Bartonella gabonensis]|uniref:helix-turn-helix domain-containing protein n=1 Tax=Bartonella gabonensis TaxID=2699889 RepID=UPI001589E966|nr:helix-turn-helix domain-containing protein [Bartonella gabonensis]
MKEKNPHSNDISIGKRIRLRREMLKISQKELGRFLGVSFQQIQKYEKGINRVGAGRLQEIADILDTSVFFFYADISTKENDLCACDERISSQKEHILLQSFRELKPKQQKAVLCLIAERQKLFLIFIADFLKLFYEQANIFLSCKTAL